MTMMRSALTALLLGAAAIAAPAAASHHGSHAAEQTVVGVAQGSKDHTTLVAAVQAAGLVGTLSGPGPFTVFAPTNAAFAKLPAGAVDGLLKPEAKGTLTSVLTYHVVPGRLMAADVFRTIMQNNGQATLTTVQGGTLTARVISGGRVELTDAKGGKSLITATDLKASNGVVHVIDTVVMP